MSAPDNKAAKRRERTPIGGTRAILEVRGKEAGFHYAWVNEDYVYQRQEEGFEHVRHPVQVGSKRIDVSQGPTSEFICRPVGKGVIAYLMRIPQEFYDEDMAALQRTVDDKTAAQIGNLRKDGLSGNVRVSSSLVKTSPDE